MIYHQEVFIHFLQLIFVPKAELVFQSLVVFINITNIIMKNVRIYILMQSKQNRMHVIPNNVPKMCKTIIL